MTLHTVSVLKNYRPGQKLQSTHSRVKQPNERLKFQMPMNHLCLSCLREKSSSQGSLGTKFYDNSTFRTKGNPLGEALT